MMRTSFYLLGVALAILAAEPLRVGAVIGEHRVQDLPESPAPVPVRTGAVAAGMSAASLAQRLGPAVVRGVTAAAAGARARVPPPPGHAPLPADVSVHAPYPGGRLEQTALVARGRLGVGIRTMTRDLADAFGLPEQEGVLVVFVDKESPAADADIERGDVILRFNGALITDARELAAVIQGRTPGTTVCLGISRNQELRNVRVMLGFWATTTGRSLRYPGPKGSDSAWAPGDCSSPEGSLLGT